MANEYKPIGQNDANQIPTIIQPQQEQKTTTTNISVLTPEAIKFKILMYSMIIILFVVLAISGAALYYKWTHQTIQTVTQESIENPQTEKALAEKAGTKISNYQANEASKTMRDEFTGKIPPTKVVETTSKDYKNVIKEESKKSGADQTIVVDKKDPTKKPEVKEGDKVELNVYNNKFYPDKQIGVTIYNDSSIALDYNIKKKIFGSTVYIGPSIMYDSKDKDFKYGVRMTFPL